MKYMSSSVVDGILDHQGVVSSMARKMKMESGAEATTEEAASELGKRGHQGSVSSMAKQMTKETGVKPTKKEPASKFGRIGAKVRTRTSPDNEPYVQPGKKSTIIWTAEDYATIVRMKANRSTSKAIALEIDNVHKKRRNR